MEDENFPKSINTGQEAYVRFYNISPRLVEVIWCNFDGIGIPYKILKSKEFVDINTYFRHYWIVNDTNTQIRMNLHFGTSRYPKTLYTPVRHESREADKRKWVFITLPLFSLKELCFQRLNNLKLNTEKLENIDLPNLLKVQYIEFLRNPNILRITVQNKEDHLIH